MHAQDSIHDLKQFLDSLSEVQLKSLSLMIDTILSSPQGGYWINGMIDQILQIKFDGCICGEKHNPEDLLSEQNQTEAIVKEDDTENLKKYGLTYNPETTYYNCDNCGLQYVSLADRMLRPPGIDGCGGCQNKSAHG